MAEGEAGDVERLWGLSVLRIIGRTSSTAYNRKRAVYPWFAWKVFSPDYSIRQNQNSSLLYALLCDISSPVVDFLVNPTLHAACPFFHPDITAASMHTNGSSDRDH